MEAISKCCQCQAELAEEECICVGCRGVYCDKCVENHPCQPTTCLNDHTPLVVLKKPATVYPSTDVVDLILGEPDEKREQIRCVTVIYAVCPTCGFCIGNEVTTSDAMKL